MSQHPAMHEHTEQVFQTGDTPNCTPKIDLYLSTGKSAPRLSLFLAAMPYRRASVRPGDCIKLRRHQFIGIPSTKWCSKGIFATRVTQGYISNSQEINTNHYSFLLKQPII
jgi:hypothetical protein